MHQIHSLQELLSYIEQEQTDYFVGVGSVRSSKSIDFTKDDKSQISIYHELDEREEFIDLEDYEQSTLFSYITDGNLYKY